MDRLICGDVGFGKTEVALRAIFCVVSAGKQAMVLAPTIVLAKQHFEVISERFSKYHNVKVGLLSRFQVGQIVVCLISWDQYNIMDIFYVEYFIFKQHSQSSMLHGCHILYLT